MVPSQENGSSNGWPLGLEIMNTRLRVVDQRAPQQPNSFHIPSFSFSSLSSSNLDTESTASFFQDHSMSLGRMIGIRPRDGGLYFPRRRISLDHHHHHEQQRQKKSEDSKGNGICIPLLLATLEKINSRSKNKSRKKSEEEELLF